MRVKCIKAYSFDDLTEGKEYDATFDKSLQSLGCIRVIDDAGDEFSYTKDRFQPVDNESRKLFESGSYW